MCVIKNNDPKHPTPYHVPAFWVPTDSLPNEFKGNLEILRCQLKDVVSAYHQLAASEMSLYIDVVKKEVIIIKVRKTQRIQHFYMIKAQQS